MKAGSKELEHDLLTQQGKGCISRGGLLRAGPPGPVVLGMLQGGPEATHDRLLWPGTTGSAPTLQTSRRKLVVLEASGKRRTSCQLRADLRLGSLSTGEQVTSLTLLLKTQRR